MIVLRDALIPGTSDGRIVLYRYDSATKVVEPVRSFSTATTRAVHQLTVSPSGELAACTLEVPHIC